MNHRKAKCTQIHGVKINVALLLDWQGIREVSHAVHRGGEAKDSHV